MSETRIQDLHVVLGAKPVLKNLDLRIAAGEFVVLAGPSGSGKSSLLRALAGLLPLQSGQIWRDQQRLDYLAPGEREIAMVFQDHALMPHLSVLDNLSFGLRARGVARPQARQRASDVADMLGLTALLTRKPSQISGGEQQRVALGRAILRDAKLVLMDEPLSSLDAPLRARLRQDILQLHRELAWTTIYVTHDQTEALGMADRLGVLIDGELRQFDLPQQVYRQPDHVQVAHFIGAGQTNLLPVTRMDAGFQLLDQQAEFTLAVRPECVTMTTDVNAQSRCLIEAEFVTHEFWGDRMMLQFRAGAHRLRVLARQQVVPTPGASCRLDLTAEDWSLYESGSGQLVSS